MHESKHHHILQSFLINYICTLQPWKNDNETLQYYDISAIIILSSCLGLFISKKLVNI